MERPTQCSTSIVATRVTRLLLLGPAREAAGIRHDEIEGETVAAVLERAVTRYGSQFEAVLAVSKIWLNGDDADPSDVVGPYDEIAVVPPVSGG